MTLARPAPFVALSLSLVLGLGVSPAKAAWRAAVEEPPRLAPEQLDLDLQGLEPIDPTIRKEIAQAIHHATLPILGEGSLPPQAVHVTVGWRDPDALDYSARIHLDAHKCVPVQEYPVATGPDTETNELADVIASNLERRLGEWDRAYEQCAGEAVEPVGDLGAPQPNPTDRPTTTEPPKPRKLTPIGAAGVSLLVIGGGAVIAGAVLAAVPDTRSTDDLTKLQDWHPAGYGLLAAGGALVLTGTILAIVGAKQTRKSRSPRQNHQASRLGRATMVPWVAGRLAGAHLAVKF